MNSTEIIVKNQGSFGEIHKHIDSERDSTSVMTLIVKVTSPEGTAMNLVHRSKKKSRNPLQLPSSGHDEGAAE